jgi:hypothetical protein
LKHIINLKNVKPKTIYELSHKFYGKDPNGEELAFTNYYMKINNEPFFAISGEFHFSRCADEFWEDELIKMKMAGINIISSYVFWIHHEETEGMFDFKGRRNLRKFIQLCHKYDLYVIVRMGPFAHGEVRNGGLPDWLYGKPFEVRSLDKGFLQCTKRWYQRVATEMEGLYYKDGGPIIAAQMDNEYMHSSAPWEITTGVSNEWISAGHEGEGYLIKLKELAKESGIDVPFYTVTGWGGAAVPAEEMIALWGGYAFWPWIFYEKSGEHPATPEYIYRDNHNNEVLSTYNFEPTYLPESKPYACCEMGGGMMNSYNYRFKLDYESIDAMANIKMGSGCNFLGYYVFKGGTNPKGEKGTFMNESQVSKMSYDYQAAIGEFGQIRPSYKRLKSMHLFVQTFTDTLCPAKTILAPEQGFLQPTDRATLRYAVRITDNKGFIFVNNYQDHAEMMDKTDETIILELAHETLSVGPFNIAQNENCILPFNMDLDGIQLKYATVTPLTVIENAGKKYYFFYMPEKMTPSYIVDQNNVLSIDGADSVFETHTIRITPPSEGMSSFTIVGKEKNIEIITLTRAQSNQFYKINYKGIDTALLVDGTLLFADDHLRIETIQNEVIAYAFPSEHFDAIPTLESIEATSIFKGYRLLADEKTIVPVLKQIGPNRYTVDIPSDCMEGLKDALLKISYTGNIGQAFIDGDMISDNFCNGNTWEIGLREFVPRLKSHPLTLYILPIKFGTNINVESTMAARLEEVKDTMGNVESISIEPIYEIVL